MLKGFVEVAGKHLHYTRAGEGPAVVMLHASPCSAKVMAPLQAVFAPRFTSFAFDLPGFGFSDPLEAAPLETADLADTIAAGIRALGLKQVAAYGRHTGAGVAVELARRHAELVSMVLTDGFPVLAQPYSPERLAEYLPPIVPRWDGGHLTWTWFRYREQHIFWPWDKADPGHRADTEVPDLDFLHRGTVEMLESGTHYPAVYASAFRHAGLAMIDQVKPPVCFGNRPGDSQHTTIGLYPPTAWVQEFARDPLEAAAQEARVLARHPGPRRGAPASQPRAARRIAGDGLYAHAGGPKLCARRRSRPARHASAAAPRLTGLGDVARGARRGRSAAAVRCWRSIRSATAGPSCRRKRRSTWNAGPTSSRRCWPRSASSTLPSSRSGPPPPLRSNWPCAVERAHWCYSRRPPHPLLGRTPTRPRSPRARMAATCWPSGITCGIRNYGARGSRQDPAHARSAPRISPADLHERAVVLLAQPHHYRPTWRSVLSHPFDEQPGARHSVPVMIAYRERRHLRRICATGRRRSLAPMPRRAAAGRRRRGQPVWCTPGSVAWRTRHRSSP